MSKRANVLQRYEYGFGEVDLSTGTIDTAKNNGQLAKIEGFIGANKQWSQRFGYDSLGRLAETREYRGDNNTLTYKQKFDFDRFGNLYRKTANNSTSGQSNPLTYTPIEDSDISKATNRFTTNTTYDDAGRVTQDNKFREVGFSYDANGRQIKATKTSQPDANTVYDGLGNRVATKVNDVWRYMVYDAFGKLIAEYGTKTQDLGGVKYVQQDHQGSVRTTVNRNGYVVGRSDHQAFGDGIGSGVGLRTNQQGYASDKLTTQGYGLTEDDEATGQQHTWFRKLETNAGRWTSPDPYKGSMSLGSSQSFNRYSYVESQPTNFVDPSGLLRIAFLYPTNCRENPDGWDFLEDKWVCDVGVWIMDIGGPGEHGEPPPIGGGGGGPASQPPAEDYNSCMSKVNEALKNTPNANKNDSVSYSRKLSDAWEDFVAEAEVQQELKDSQITWQVVGGAVGAGAGAAIGSFFGSWKGAVAGGAAGLIVGATVATGSAEKRAGISTRHAYEKFQKAESRARRDFPAAAKRADHLAAAYKAAFNCALKYGAQNNEWWRSVNTRLF